MLVDHGCGLDQYHGVDHLRPDPVEPHPQQPIQGRKLRPAGTLSVQNGQLMLQGNKLKLQCGATAKTQGNDRNNGRENRQHFLTVRSARENHQPLSARWRVLSKDSGMDY